MTATLAIGPYVRRDAAALERAFDARRVLSLTEAGALDAAVRREVRAIAYRAHDPFDADAMALFPSLGLIANFGVGHDAIDVGEAARRGIRVTNTPDVLNDDVADLAVGLLIAQFRDMIRGDAHIRDGRWPDGSPPLARSLTGARIGILGLGRIGGEIAARLAAFKTELHYWSRSRKVAPPGTWHGTPLDLARAVEVLIVAIVGGAKTRGMVSAEILDALGPGGVLVNVSRGSAVDEDALLCRLQDGRLAGAALDVFRNEPRIDPRFMALKTTVLQPHMGSATQTARSAMAAVQRDNIAAFLDGRDLPTPVV